MARPPTVYRQWFINIPNEDARVRCSFQRRGKVILYFTAQLEIMCQGSWAAVERYDNAHGFCHRDTIHPDGTQEKTPVFIGDANETFTKAAKDLVAN